jgi:hypothetical protein
MNVKRGLTGAAVVIGLTAALLATQNPPAGPSLKADSLLVGYYVAYAEQGADAVDTVPALHFPGFASLSEAHVVAERIRGTDARHIGVYHAERRGGAMVLVRVED